MKAPRLFAEGLADLVRENPQKEIRLLLIPKQSKETDFYKASVEYIKELGLAIKSVQEYIPPPGIALSKKQRKESIPEINDHASPMVIIDDCIEYGTTLIYTVEMLQRQGVSPDNIWCHVYDIMMIPPAERRGYSFLDKATNILEYLAELVQ